MMSPRTILRRGVLLGANTGPFGGGSLVLDWCEENQKAAVNKEKKSKKRKSKRLTVISRYLWLK